MTGYQNFNGSNVNLNGNFGLRRAGREERCEKSIYEKMLDICCAIVLFFDKKSVKVFVGIAAVLTFTIGVFLLISAAVRGEMNFLPAFGWSALITAVCAVCIRYAESD